MYAHPQKVLHKRHLVYCVRFMSAGCTRVAANWHNTQAIYQVPFVKRLPMSYRAGVGEVQPPPPKFLSFDKAEPNSQFCGKYIRNHLIRKQVSLIYN
jgi:hypothetical protein